MDGRAGTHGRSSTSSRRLPLTALLLLGAALVCALAVGAPGRGTRGGARAALHPTVRPLGRFAGAGPFRRGVVLVGFRAGVSASQREVIERAAGGRAARRLGPPVKPEGRGAVASEEYLAPYALEVPATHELAAVRALRAQRGVAYAEPDYLLTASALPTDPSFPLQWGSHNTGQAIPAQEINEVIEAPAAGTAGADDGAYKAWQIGTGSRSIVIGETDTGVDYTHPDLATNVWTNAGNVGGCAKGTRGYNVLNKTCNPMDEDTAYGGHGTHVAGIMGAVANNGQGVAGMNWQTTILPVRWMNQAGFGETSALIEALQWLVAAKQAGVNVRVENDSDTFFGTAYSQALSNEIDVLGANNILFVTSSGNTGNNNDEVAVQRYPCSYDRPTEICVAPTDNNDQIPSWGNYGAHTVDLAAPGVSIYSTLRGGTYGYLSGSSMAAPQVSGAAALILSVAPSMSTAALKADILEHVDHLPSLAGRVITGGRLDVCKAMPGCGSLPSQPPASTSGPTITGSAALGQTLTDVHGAWTNQPSTYAYRWQRCDRSGGGCGAINAATSQTYAPASQDVGHTLRVQETASNIAGSGAPSVSGATAVVVATTPANGHPNINGQASVGATLTAQPGGWNESPTAYAYQWQRCDAKGNNCAPIAQANAAEYAVAEADAGNTLRVAVTATNALGSSAPATSNQTPMINWQQPSNTAPPTIAGTAQSGQTLTASPGSWSGVPTSFGYAWQRCQANGGGCAAIAGAAAQTYQAGEADVGHALRVIVTASNPSGHAQTATSQPSETVLPAQAPTNTSVPTISGTPQTGQTLTEVNGGWTNQPSTYAYQWQRCDSSGGGCGAINGATAQTYVPVSGDVNHTLRVVETASNAAGSGTATSARSAPVVASAPVNTGRPNISGQADVGQTLTASTGQWKESPTAYAYQWQRCDAHGNNCAPIALATTTEYTAVEADAGNTLRVLVTASSPAGASEPTASNATPVVGWQQPANAAPPTVTGTARSGESLTASPGSWSGAPTGFAYQWQRCEALGANCGAIAGATATTYLLGEADVGHALRVVVTASNPSGKPQSATSAQTEIVGAPQPPSATSPPTVSGTAQQGQTLTEAHGTWSNEPSGFAYQWLRCDASGGSCQPILGATAQAYVLLADDVGHTLRVQESASNELGTGSPEGSSATAVVSAAENTATFGKTSVGAFGDEGMFSNYKIVHSATLPYAGTVTQLSVYAIPGIASPSPQSLKAVIYADSGGAPGALVASGREVVYRGNFNGRGWFDLPLASPTTLAAGTYWLGFITGPTSEGMGYIYDWSWGSRDYNENAYSSEPSNPFGPASTDGEQASIYATYVPSTATPVNRALPAITGTARQGQTLSASPGSWTGSPSSYSYSWQSCEASGANCSPIAGANSPEYVLGEGDVGRALRVSVTATNAEGESQPALSAASETIAPPQNVPANSSTPTVAGTAQQGRVLSAHPGTWSETPTGYAYQWQRCEGASCSPIAGATLSSYNVGEADVGKTLRVTVAASNEAGTSTAVASAPTAVIAGSAGISHLEYVLLNGSIAVYDMDHAYKQLNTISLPQTEAQVRGVSVAPSSHLMFVMYGGDGGVNGNGSVLAYDLVTQKVVWESHLASGVDSGQVSPDGTKLYIPSGELSEGRAWNVLSASNGELLSTIQGPSGPHNTVVSNDGRYVYLGGRASTYLGVYETATGKVKEVGPLIGTVRPLTANGSNTLAFTTATNFDGFQVSSIQTGKVLFTVPFVEGAHEFPFSAPSHGIALSPDERTVYALDSLHKAVQFYNVAGVAEGVAPAPIGTVALSGLSGEESRCSYDCTRSGWLQLSLDGRYLFVGDSGEVIETATRKVIATLSALAQTKKSIEVDWQSGVPVATSGRTGVGYVE
jgi:subtilisin family serine protease